MVEQLLDLEAVAGAAVGVPAGARVHQQRHRARHLAVPLVPLRVRHARRGLVDLPRMCLHATQSWISPAPYSMCMCDSICVSPQVLHQERLCLQGHHASLGLEVSKRSYHKLVVVTIGLLAVAAHVEVLADRAAESGARLDLHLALVAGGSEGGRLGVVQMVQDHHAAVLGAAHAVELVVVALAERQELLRPDTH